nr:MAG TPA: KilA protein [Caudoviricetes sp.]
MSNLAILNTSIRSYENLFSLNDLHQASGNLAKHKPAFFLRIDTTKDLIAEIEKETPNALKVIRGTQGGTYACEELVIAYAMWISPKFHLIVLRAFLNLHKKSTALLPSTITQEQQQAIQSAVQQAHHRTGLHWQEIYRQLKAMFHIAKYDQLPQSQFGNAMAFIMNLQPIALPPVEKKFTFEFTEYELQQLVWAWFALLRGTELCEVLHPSLKQIGSYYAAPAHDIAYEYRSNLRQAHNVLTRITEQFECKQGNNWRVLKHLRAYNPKKTGFQLEIL